MTFYRYTGVQNIGFHWHEWKTLAYPLLFPINVLDVDLYYIDQKGPLHAD
jgi:hypothetical protein